MPMPEDVRRGFVPGDEREFSGHELEILRRAQSDVALLLDRGYASERSVAFVGDRFQLSARQRTALARATCSGEALRRRKSRELTDGAAGRALTIDGFNLIITLETAFSGSTVLRCMDGTLRDLCGLRGTYRLIAGTQTVLGLIADELTALGVGSAVFVLDAPVSNSGRLKQRILERMAGRPFSADAVLSVHADADVAAGECAVTSDSAVLDRCGCWLNLAALIAQKRLPGFSPIDLSNGNYRSSC